MCGGSILLKYFFVYAILRKTVLHKAGKEINMEQFNETVKINTVTDNSQKVHDIMTVVYDALKKKGYNPINQLVAYLMSDDPTYITSYNNARILISRLERDEILEEFAKEYVKTL